MTTCRPTPRMATSCPTNWNIKEKGTPKWASCVCPYSLSLVMFDTSNVLWAKRNARSGDHARRFSKVASASYGDWAKKIGNPVPLRAASQMTSILAPICVSRCCILA